MNCDLDQSTSFTTKKEYRFHAGTTKEERILGLCFPFVYMGILLICILLFELLFPLQHFTKLLNQYYFIEVVIILVGLLPSIVILKSIKKRLGHEFRVVIEKQSRGIEMNYLVDDELYTLVNGFSHFCIDLTLAETITGVKLEVYRPS